jgi:hypothetical protein
MRRGTGTLNGSSPTANLAGVNIKGNEAFLHFPEFGFHGGVLQTSLFGVVRQPKVAG